MHEQMVPDTIFSQKVLPDLEQDVQTVNSFDFPPTMALAQVKVQPDSGGGHPGVAIARSKWRRDFYLLTAFNIVTVSGADSGNIILIST